MEKTSFPSPLETLATPDDKTKPPPPPAPPSSVASVSWVERVTHLTKGKEALLVIAGVSFGLGYVSILVNAYRFQIGFIPPLQTQCVLAGLVPSIGVVVFFGVARGFIWLEAYCLTRFVRGQAAYRKRFALGVVGAIITASLYLFLMIHRSDKPWLHTLVAYFGTFACLLYFSINERTSGDEFVRRRRNKRFPKSAIRKRVRLYSYEADLHRRIWKFNAPARAIITPLSLSLARIQARRRSRFVVRVRAQVRKQVRTRPRSEKYALTKSDKYLLAKQVIAFRRKRAKRRKAFLRKKAMQIQPFVRVLNGLNRLLAYSPLMLIALAIYTFWFTFVYRNIPQEFGGMQPRIASIALTREQLSPELQRVLLPKVQGAPSSVPAKPAKDTAKDAPVETPKETPAKPAKDALPVVQSKPLDVLYENSEVMVVRTHYTMSSIEQAAPTVYQIKKSSIQGVTWQGYNERP